jgi:isopentenyl-diphosphate Delta-isomerase
MIINLMVDIQARKDEHIKLALENKLQSNNSNWLENVQLIHNALPDIDFSDIDCSMNFLGKKISAPLIIDSLTGGTEKGKVLNQILAETAQELNIGMGVGSQRISLDDPSVENTFSIVRESAPDIPIIANIGIAQIIQMSDLDSINRIIDPIKANALAIHLNPVQEIIQPDGDTKLAGSLQKISEIKEKVKIPVIIKEVGSGISSEVAKKLVGSGIEILNIAGVGGTSFAKAESIRAKTIGDKLKKKIGENLFNWGIPTAASILECRSVADKSLTIIGIGGIRSGLDMAKAMAIGANLCGMAQPMLRYADKGKANLNKFIQSIIVELKSVMFLTGCSSLTKLYNAPKILQSPLREWVLDRKLR